LASSADHAVDTSYKEKTMEISEQDKVQILLAQLDRRYEGIEKIRERVYSISIWTLGIFLGAAGLIVQGNVQLSLPAKIFLALAEALALVAILFYIRDLERGFRNQFQVVVQIEILLGLGKQGFFAPEEALYPSEWAQAGTKLGRGQFFRNTYWLLYLGAAILLVAIGTAGLLF
jgi:hypothetical protein